MTVQETFVGTPIVAATVGPGIDFGDDVPLNPPVVITLGLLPLSENASVRTHLNFCLFIISVANLNSFYVSLLVQVPHCTVPSG